VASVKKQEKLKVKKIEPLEDDVTPSSDDMSDFANALAAAVTKLDTPAEAKNKTKSAEELEEDRVAEQQAKDLKANVDDDDDDILKKAREAS
jgi:hypothetical protein